MKARFLSRFTPSLMKPEALEAIFVQREELAQRLIEHVRDSVLTPSKHHALLIGPRGIGKTHLIALVYHRVQKMDDLSDHLLIAWLREEEWGVTSFLDLLLRIFRALLEEYNDAELSERVESLYDLPSDDTEGAGAMLLKEYVGERTLLILVENLDDLFEGLGDEGQKRLRAYIQENPFCTILATAQGLFNGVSLQTSPFYGFFRSHHLEVLEIEDATLLLRSIAKFEGDRKLATFIQTVTGRTRVDAVHHLAGGNHRVYVIFAQFLTSESLDQLVGPLMRTLDDLTPYYQARMMWLSPQQRKIVEFLCDRRHAVPVNEIAQRSFITQQTASSQLKTLRQKGYVRSDSIGRESYYELNEPLMRLCIEIKKHRGEPIRLLVDFLRLWYSRKELQRRLELLQPDAALEREYMTHALQATEEEAGDSRVAACLTHYNAHIKKSDFVHALQVAEELVMIRGHARDWFVQGYCLGKLGRLDEALEPYDRAIELNPNNALAWNNRGLALYELGRHHEALASLDKAIQLDPNNALAWYSRSVTLSGLGHHDEALESYNKVIEPDPNNALVWYNRGVTLSALGHHDEALESYNKVIELDPNDTQAWHNRGVTLSDLGRYDEALMSCDKVIELGGQSSYVFFNRAEFLLALDRWEEGMTELDDALKRFAHTEGSVTGDTGSIIGNLFTSARDAATWRTRIETLIALYDKHDVLSALGLGLGKSVSALTSPMVSDEAKRIWGDEWQELTGDRDEFEIPLRLLDVAVRYLEKRDRRVLLELPVEERKLLEPLLEEKESSKA